jgi:iron(III) transport system substrate-binding protein
MTPGLSAPSHASRNHRLPRQAARVRPHWLAQLLALLISASMVAGCGVQLPQVALPALPQVSLPWAQATPAPVKKSINIYTVLSQGQLDAYLPLFKSERPDIEVKYTRMSTWDLVKKILAEKNDPQADIIWGLAATAMLQVQSYGLLEPYSPPNLSKVNIRMRDSSTPPHWIGTDVWESAFCVNTALVGKLGLPTPTSWQDLTDPIYKNYIVMSNPNSSGTGFLSVSAWLQLWGEDEAWKYMDEVNRNVVVYTDSGRQPCTLAADGKIPIGVAFGSAAIDERKLNKPVIAVFPDEGSGWEIETVGLVRRKTVTPQAMAFMDWSISAPAMWAYAQFYPVTSVTTNVPIPDGYLKEPIKQLISNRFRWASANYERIVNKWLSRYESKAQTGSYDIPESFR